MSERIRKIVLVGHSHIAALSRGFELLGPDLCGKFSGHQLPLLGEKFLPEHGGSAESARRTKVLANRVSGINTAAVKSELQRLGPDAAILSLNGSEHSVLGFFRSEAMGPDRKAAKLRRAFEPSFRDWMRFLKPHLPATAVAVLPPPPIESEQLIRDFPGKNRSANRFVDVEIEPPLVRLDLWKRQCDLIRSVCGQFGIPVVDLPPDVFSESGFLAQECWGGDPTHGNDEFGRRVVRDALDTIGRLVSRLPASSGVSAPSRADPYALLPDHCFWRQSVGDIPRDKVDPVVTPKFLIDRADRVATAGSCFAQHISRRLRDTGYSHFVAEPEPEGAPESDRSSYYDFSARYGNIYTARQLLQLFDRAFGYFRPTEKVWIRKGGGYCDPFRPRIESRGYPSEEAVAVDQRIHLAAVRRMFRELDVFVFTLGLTESWVSRLDGAVYPVAPGVVGGRYVPKKHVFHNFSVAEVVDDLRQFLAKLQLVNPAARVILTVSPVPLVATASGEHVLQATVYSKSVLRVAAAETAAAHDNVFYFPSYEIITGPHAGGAYLEADLRSVTPSGVDHVMRVFMAHLAAQPTAAEVSGEAASIGMDNAYDIVEALCDEEMLAR